MECAPGTDFGGNFVQVGRTKAEAQFLQGPIDRVVGHRQAELVQARDQVASPPAHRAVDGRDRTLVQDACAVLWQTILHLPFESLHRRLENPS